MGGTLLVVLPCMEPKWLDTEATRSRVTAADAAMLQDVVEFLKMLPMLFAGTLAFSAVYNPMQFWYQQQACQMDVRIGHTQLSGSWFNIADCIAIVVVTPVAVIFVNPFLEKQFPSFGTGAKFGLGIA